MEAKLDEAQIDMTPAVLERLAIEGKWDEIDAVIGSVADDPEFLAWAIGSLHHDHPEVRDLAVSILEVSSEDLPIQTALVLRERMVKDSNPYVRFRSAFALFNHGDRSKDIMVVIEAAAQDDDTKEPAEACLARFEQEQLDKAS